MSTAGWDLALIGIESVPVVLIVALLGAWLSLDETSLGQTWIGQPLPAATLTAWLLGEPSVGLLIGLPFQLVTLGNLPVGQSFLGDKSAAVVGVVAAAVMTGFLDDALNSAVLRPGPGSGRIGWLLILLALASLASHRLVKLERSWRVGWGTLTLRSIRDGGTGHLDRVQGMSLAVTGLRGAGTALAIFWLAKTVWQPGFNDLPLRWHDGLEMLPWLTPAVGLGALADLYASRAGVRWMVGAFVLTLALVWVAAWRGMGA